MTPAIHIPTTGGPEKRAPGICQRILIRIAVKVMVVALFGPGLIGTAFAIEQPPATASQQRAWLVGHLVTDMQNVGSFTSSDLARMTSLVNALTDQQASLLAQFYYLTREKTEQDTQLYDVGQSDTAAALAQAKAQAAGVLAQLQNQIQQLYSELASINSGCQTLCQVAYASVPGWCAYNQYAIPDAYYSNGCYVGPVYSANYCGAYAVPVYKVFYNHGSHYNWWSRKAYIHKKIAPIARLPKVIHAPAAVVKHVAPVQHKPVAIVKKHAAAHVVHVNKARPASRAHARAHTTHVAAHSHPKAAAHRVAHVRAHAAPRAHVQHAAHASHGSGGHGRRK